MDFPEHFAQYGLLGLVLAGIGYLIYWGLNSVANYLAPHIDRVVEAHASFVESCGKSLSKMSESIESIDARLTSLEDIAEKQVSILDKLSCHTNGKPRNQDE